MVLDRAGLPQEFYDITSTSLLIQPEPQYLHCALIKQAMGAFFDPSIGDLALPGRPTIGGAGASYSDTDAQRLMLADPIFSQSVTFVQELGKGVGDTVRINRPVWANTTYTEASREIQQGATIGTTPVNITGEQAVITLKKWGGPYNGSAVGPIAVDRFYANRAVHSVADITSKHLRRDFDKTLDTFGVSLFDQGANVVYPSGMTADTDSSAVGDYPFDFNTISRTEQKMDELFIPRFANGRRAMVITPHMKQELSDDAQFARYAAFHAPINPVLAQSYYKTVGGFDLFQSSTLNVNLTGTGSSPVHYGQAFGPGGVGVGMSEMPRVANNMNDNYGETAFVIWLMYAGFTVLDNRFLVSVRCS